MCRLGTSTSKLSQYNSNKVFSSNQLLQLTKTQPCDNYNAQNRATGTILKYITSINNKRINSLPYIIRICTYILHKCVPLVIVYAENVTESYLLRNYFIHFCQYTKSSILRV